MTEGDPSAEISAVTSGYQDPEIHGLKHTKSSPGVEKTLKGIVTSALILQFQNSSREGILAAAEAQGGQSCCCQKCATFPKLSFFRNSQVGHPSCQFSAPFLICCRDLYSLFLSTVPCPHSPSKTSRGAWKWCWLYSRTRIRDLPCGH